MYIHFCNYRYRLIDDQWIKEPTSYRGQWGITKDNFGRLYVNNNSTQIQGDHVLPNTAIRNHYYKPKYLFPYCFPTQLML